LLSEWCGTLDELQLGYSPFVAMGEAKGVSVCFPEGNGSRSVFQIWVESRVVSGVRSDLVSCSADANIGMGGGMLCLVKT